MTKRNDKKKLKNNLGLDEKGRVTIPANVIDLVELQGFEMVLEDNLLVLRQAKIN